jgi:hypothetical protein
MKAGLLLQKERLEAKVARLPEGEARGRAQLHLREVESALAALPADPPASPKPGKAPEKS